MQKSLFYFLFVLILSTNAILTKNQLKFSNSKTSQNSLKAATLSVGSVSSTGSFSLTALVPASNAAISYQFLEGTTVVFTGTLTSGNANQVPLTYTVSGKAAGTYAYSVLLWDSICLSASSNVVNVIVPAAATVITNTLQAATLSVGTVLSGTYTLTANIPCNNAAVSYKILEGTTVISAGTLVFGNVNSISLVHTLSAKVAGSYSYTVVLSDASNVSVTSNAVVVTVPAATVVNSLQAATLSVGAVTSGTFTLTANIPCYNTAVSYQILEGTTVIAAGSLTVGNVNSISLVHTLSAKASGSYSYTVVLLDASSVSAHSNAVAVTVPAVTVNSLQAATLSAGTITSGTFTLTANIPCYNTAISYKVLEGTTVIAAGTLSVGNANQISLVHTVTGKAAGSYSYTVVLLDGNSVSVSSNVVSLVVPSTTASSTTTTSNTATTTASVNAWAAGVTYKTGDLVSYSGKNYKCLTGHNSIVSWEPTNAFTLWSPQ